MKIKTFAIAAMLVALTAAGFSGDIVRFDFNCYGSDADIVPVDKLPNGVTIGKKAPFNNPKIVGRATPLFIDIDKIRTVDLKFTFSGKPGKIVLIFGIETRHFSSFTSDKGSPSHYASG